MNSLECATRYPFILVHGTGFRDWGYWGRIPQGAGRAGSAGLFRRAGRLGYGGA